MSKFKRTENEITIYLDGRVPSLKNDRVQFILNKGKINAKAVSFKNNEYREWYNNSRTFIHSVLKEDLLWTHVHIDIIVFFGNKIGADLPNAVDSIMDLVRDCTIIWNDTYYCVSSNNNKAIYRKGRPGCIIKIKKKNTEFFLDN